MEYITLPGTDIKVSRVVLGSWAIGGWMWGGTDEDASIRTIHAALDKGVNMVDTAPVYGFGTSERIVGKALQSYSQSEDIMVSTKVALDWTEQGKVMRNSTRDRIMKEVDDSLRRLQRDHIDLYYVHWPDPLVPFEETARAMQDLKEQGKIRAIGVSNHSPEQMQEFMKQAELSMCQPPYNMFEREIDDDIKPWCENNGVGLMTYGALCRGLLSGKMDKQTTFTGDDLRKSDPKFQQPRFDQYLEAVDKLKGLARELDRDILPMAVRWVLDQGVDIALWGGRRPDQMEPLPEVFGWHMDQKSMERVDAILQETITDPVGPEFMAPPSREE